MKHNFTSYIKSLSFIFFSMNLAFASNAVDTIVKHHTQRRILVNTDIIGNESSIRHESDAITGILTTTTVNVERQASPQEKWNILRAAMGGRFIARTTEYFNTGKYEEIQSNPYTDVLKKLTPDNVALRDHYRVLELTYDLGDCVGTGDLKSETFYNIVKSLSALTGMGNHFYQSLIESVLWEHHLATCDQVTQNIFELVPQFEQKNKSWLTKIALNAVVEIKNHPLSEFAQKYMDLMPSDSESEDEFYSEADQESILESLNSIWGIEYSPYQFSAAKFLTLSPYKSFWSIGIRVLNNIDQYGIALKEVDIKILQPRRQFTEKFAKGLENCQKNISQSWSQLNRASEIRETMNSDKANLLSTMTEGEEKEKLIKEKNKTWEETEGNIEKIFSSCKELSSEATTTLADLTHAPEKLKLLSYWSDENQQLVRNFLYIGQWDCLRNADINQQLLKHEVMVAKNLIARNKPENLTLIIDQFLLLAKELLSLNVENTRYEELKSTLAQYDYLFLSADNVLSVTYKIKIAEQLKLEIKEETKLDIATRGILNEFLSLAERSSRYKEIKFKLFHVLLHNSPKDNPNYLTALIFDSVTNTDEVVQTRKETVAA